MRKKNPVAVFFALVFAMSLCIPALVADAAGPGSKDYEKRVQPPPQSPLNPNAKAWMDGQKNPNQPAKPQPATPQAASPAAPAAKPPAAAQPPRPNVKSPGPSPQDPKKNATFVNKVNTAPGPTPAGGKTPPAGRGDTGYRATLKDLGH